jgi:hypothetical protein
LPSALASIEKKPNNVEWASLEDEQNDGREARASSFVPVGEVRAARAIGLTASGHWTATHSTKGTEHESV